MYTSIQSKRLSLNSCIDPIIGGGIAAGAGSLLSGLFGGLFGSSSTAQTNKMNYKIAKEQMQWQEQMQDKQNQWNLDQWNRENQYNSAAAQVQRYLQAGINPALAMTNGASAGQAGSLQSAQPASSPNMPQMQPFLPDFSSLADAGNQIGQQLYNLPKQAAEIQNLGAQNAVNEAQANLYKSYRTSEFIKQRGYRLDNKGKRIMNSLNDMNYKIAQVNFDILDRTSNAQIKSAELQNTHLLSEVANNFMSLQEKAIIQHYLPQQLQKDLQLKSAQIFNLGAQAGLFREQTNLTKKQQEEIGDRINLLRQQLRTEIQNTLREQKKNGLIPDAKLFTNEQIQRIADAYVNSNWYASLNLENEYNINKPIADEWEKSPFSNTLIYQIGRLLHGNIGYNFNGGK